VKDFFVRWTARGPIVTFVIAVLAGASGPAWAGGGKTALVAVGFTGAPPAGFQNVLLNVQGVRINPHANAGPGSNGWQLIPTPPGIGGGNQSAELQIDLNTSQDVPELFNTSKVRPGTYKVAQILLDPNNPGSLIPNCPQSPGGPEGCISYPIALTNGQVIVTPEITGFSVKNGTVAQLILQVRVMLSGPAPIVAGGAYQATISLNASTSGLGIVTGQINAMGSSSGSTGKLIKLGVTGETIGTNTAIGTALVKNHTYTLMLPAASGFGTLYDLAVAGGGDSYAAARLPPLFPGATINGPTFAVTGQAVGNITGSVMDGCTAGKPVVGATLQLLVPPCVADPTTSQCTEPNPAIDCSNPTMAAQCITVASATTDNAGNFPLPGSLTTPPQFQNVPAPPSKNPMSAYAMEVTAPGYDPLFVQVKPSTGTTGKNSGGVCSVGGGSFSKCSLLMPTAFISGSIPITPPLPGQTTLVQVFAEPSGTNDIQSSLPMPISNRNPNGLVKFTINVPSKIGLFDLFATTIDQYQGSSDPYPGHSIAVLSGVEMPMEACSTNAAHTADFVDTIDCVGHGSIIGTANNANLGASIALSKPDPSNGNEVQITTAQIQNQSPAGGPSPSNSYAFCVPADTYQLQPVQLPLPVDGVAPSIAPTAYPTGEPATVTIMPAPLIHVTPSPTPTSSGMPSATPTPPPFKTSCPTTCSNPDGSCPGICNTTVQGLIVPTPLPPPPPTATPTATATP
jgi:hypothetical protein